MAQDLHNDKLFEAAQRHLKDYEAPYDAAGWEKMNRALDSQPRATGISRKWMLNGLLAFVAAGGLAWGIYNYASAPASKAEKPASIPAQPVVVQPSASPQINSAAPVANTEAADNNTPAITVAQAVNGNTDASAVVKTKKHRESSEQTAENGTPLEKPLNDFGDADAIAIPANGSAPEDFIFPDQIDPLHGVTRGTHENPRTYNGLTPPDPLSLDYYDAPGKKVPLSVDTSKKKTKKDSATGPQK